MTTRKTASKRARATASAKQPAPDPARMAVYIDPRDGQPYLVVRMHADNQQQLNEIRNNQSITDRLVADLAVQVQSLAQAMRGLTQAVAGKK